MSEDRKRPPEKSDPDPNAECRCVQPVVLRHPRDAAVGWYCGTCGCCVPRRWQPPPELDALIRRLAQLSTYDDFVCEFGEPESLLSGAELRMPSLLARVPSDVAARYASGPERVRQAHWKFGNVLSLVVFEHCDGSVTHQIGLVRSPREV